MNKTDVSVIVPVFNECDNLPVLMKELSEVIDTPQLGSSEILFINDGSSDGSKEVLDRLASENHRVRVLHLRRNFGQSAAMSAGFTFARGEVVIPMDGDLQNDPRDIPALLEKMSEGYDLVSGWRKDRKDRGLSRKMPSFFANRLISWVTGVKLNDYGCTLKAYRKELAQRMQVRGEMHRFLPALAAMIGARVAEIPVHHRARQHGTSKYGIDRTFRVLMDLMTIRYFMQFFSRPMHFLGWPGGIMLTSGVGLGIYMSYLKLFAGEAIGGRPLLLLAVLLIVTGIQILGMGLIAEMLARIYYDSSGHQPFEIREIVGEINE